MPVRAFIYIVIAVTLCGPAQGEEIRDFYSEPGLNPFKETIHQENHEHIDPFSHNTWSPERLAYEVRQVKVRAWS